MKKAVSMFLIICLFFSLGGCGEAEMEETTENNAVAEAEEIQVIDIADEDGILEAESGIDETCVHEWSDWDYSLRPTCEEEGHKSRTCKKCGGVQTYLVPALGHTPEVVPAVAATCTSSGLTEGTVCAVCHHILTLQEMTPRLEHDYVWVTDVEATGDTDGLKHEECSMCHEKRSEGTVIPKLNHDHKLVKTEAVAATCQEEGNTEYWTCSVCGQIFSDAEGKNAVAFEDTVVSKLDHVLEYVPAVHATAGSEGLTSGYRCAVCHEVIVEQEAITKYKYTDPELYASDYGYNSLAQLENGKAMMQFYEKLDEICLEFHNNSGLDLENQYFGYVNYTELGLTKTEALATFGVYKMDHPLFYWISNTVVVNATMVAPCVDSDYYSGSVRANYNDMIYKTVAGYANAIDFSSKTAYETAISVHDIIIDGIEYAFDENGDPESSNWAHNILGLFEKGKGVCECYAKCFNLLLNCFGVESVYVTGYTGSVAHAWNMAKSDEGEWYICDLTWDDNKGEFYGNKYLYFFVTENQKITYEKDGEQKSLPAIGTNHEARESDLEDRTNYQYKLPECSTSVYKQ